VSTRVGLYFGLLQLFFWLSWVEYVIYLPKLAAQAGIDRGVVPWILVLDQAIFALCDWGALLPRVKMPARFDSLPHLRMPAWRGLSWPVPPCWW